MDFLDYKYRKHFSEETAQFLMDHPLLLNTITLAHNLGSSFNLETNSLNIGVHKNLRTDWVLHELGHIIVASHEELLLPDYGVKLAENYTFDQLLTEHKVFRKEIVLAKHIKPKEEKTPKFITKNINYIHRQHRISLTNSTASELDALLESVTDVFRTPISQQEIDTTLDELNNQLKYLKGFNPNPIHFEAEPDLSGQCTVEELEKVA